MKKLVLFAAVALLSFTMNAQTTTAPKPAPKPAPAPTGTTQTVDPGYKFDVLEHDYGTIQKGADPYCEFRLTNTGKEPLIIASAIGSCGCTVPEYTKEPIAPGQTVIIKVRYDTQRIGHFEKTVTITFTGKSEPVVLKIHGTVEAPPAEQPFPTPGSGTGNSGAPVNQEP